MPETLRALGKTVPDAPCYHFRVSKLPRFRDQDLTRKRGIKKTLKETILSQRETR